MMSASKNPTKNPQNVGAFIPRKPGMLKASRVVMSQPAPARPNVLIN